MDYLRKHEQVGDTQVMFANQTRTQKDIEKFMADFGTNKSMNVMIKIGA
jgi:hypothetical protein